MGINPTQNVKTFCQRNVNLIRQNVTNRTLHKSNPNVTKVKYLRKLEIAHRKKESPEDQKRENSLGSLVYTGAENSPDHLAGLERGQINRCSHTKIALGRH